MAGAFCAVLELPLTFGTLQQCGTGVHEYCVIAAIAVASVA